MGLVLTIFLFVFCFENFVNVFALRIPTFGGICLKQQQKCFAPNTSFFYFCNIRGYFFQYPHLLFCLLTQLCVAPYSSFCIFVTLDSVFLVWFLSFGYFGNVFAVI